MNQSAPENAKLLKQLADSSLYSYGQALPSLHPLSVHQVLVELCAFLTGNVLLVCLIALGALVESIYFDSVEK
jgi:hypothetical protein